MSMIVRRRILNVFLVTLLLFPGACTGKATPGDPREAVTGYLEALFSGSREGLESYLPPGGTPGPAVTPPFETRFIRGYLARLVSFRIEDVTVSGDRAEARVLITEPDFRAVLHEVGEALGDGHFPEDDLEVFPFVTETLGSYAVKYRKEGVPGRSYRALIHLAREGDSWKILRENMIGN